MPQKAPKLERPEKPTIQDRVRALPLLPPPECDARLTAAGYRGQGAARRAGAVMAYRHVRRLKRVVLEGADPEAIGSHDNYLFIGPTGCGKTYLIELLFRDILQVPTLIVDVTQYSETGYVGEDVNMILSRLFEAADQDLLWAACGVVCLDEFDKLASSRSNARFAGEGTTKDVSGYGVQRGLLTLLAGREMMFPVDFGYAHLGPKINMPLWGVTFVACGAFSGLKTTADLLGESERIGFGRTAKPQRPEAIAVRFDDRVLEQTAAFARYGFLPELIGRFSRLVSFAPLDESTLRAILVDSVVKPYVEEFAGEGVVLTVDQGVFDNVVAQALKRELGARGLRAALLPYLEDAAYASFGQEPSQVHLHLDQGEICVKRRTRDQ
jgi:ATP-dependent Clp protease ATP-binding subunit ClpX